MIKINHLPETFIEPGMTASKANWRNTWLKKSVDRFWKSVLKTDTCWMWVGDFRSSGYGVHWINSKRYSAHRLSYEWSVGKIPEGRQLDHLCRNRACVNPDHLEVVSHRENLVRGLNFIAENAKKTHCKRGHEFTDENTKIKIYKGSKHRRCLICTEEYNRIRNFKRYKTHYAKTLKFFSGTENKSAKASE